MRNNTIPMFNIVTRHATVEPTGVVTYYRGVRPNININNNNYVALAGLFPPSTLHELR